MTPIRPNAFPTQPPTTVAGQAGDAARSAAQRAFFDAALGRAGAAAAPQAAQAATFAPQVSTQATPAQRAELRPAATPIEPPQKILRPGSLLDIRV